MQNELRPCAFIWWNKEIRGLFHCFSDYEDYKGKSETVALVEIESKDGGRIVMVSPNKLCFLDTKKQMERFFMSSNFNTRPMSNTNENSR